MFSFSFLVDKVLRRIGWFRIGLVLESFIEFEMDFEESVKFD